MRCLSNFVSFFGTSDIGPWFAEREIGGLPHEQLERYWKLSPLAYVGNVTTPILILHSEQDLRCPIEQGEQWFTSLRRLGKDDMRDFLRVLLTNVADFADDELSDQRLKALLA